MYMGKSVKTSLGYKTVINCQHATSHPTIILLVINENSCKKKLIKAQY